MNKTGKATQISDFSYALPVDDCVYTISTAQANNLDTLLWQAERENWEYMPQYVGGQKIVPYGNNNRLPVQIRDLMDENNLAPGILARQKGLLYGEGPFLRSLRRKGPMMKFSWSMGVIQPAIITIIPTFICS